MVSFLQFFLKTKLPILELLDFVGRERWYMMRISAGTVHCCDGKIFFFTAASRRKVPQGSLLRAAFYISSDIERCENKRASMPQEFRKLLHSRLGFYPCKISESIFFTSFPTVQIEWNLAFPSHHIWWGTNETGTKIASDSSNSSQGFLPLSLLVYLQLFATLARDNGNYDQTPSRNQMLRINVLGYEIYTHSQVYTYTHTPMYIFTWHQINFLFCSSILSILLAVPSNFVLYFKEL